MKAYKSFKNKNKKLTDLLLQKKKFHWKELSVICTAVLPKTVTESKILEYIWEFAWHISIRNI